MKGRRNEGRVERNTENERNGKNLLSKQTTYKQTQWKVKCVSDN